MVMGDGDYSSEEALFGQLAERLYPRLIIAAV
jgi:hypothetical protein